MQPIESAVDAPPELVREVPTDRGWNSHIIAARWDLHVETDIERVQYYLGGPVKEPFVVRSAEASNQ